MRRRSPHRIISWSRLMAGNWRDPLVGRDVLIGVVLGLGIHAAFVGLELVTRSYGWPADLFTRGVSSGGAGEMASTFLGQPFLSLLHGMGYVLLLLLLSLPLKKEWPAAVALWLLFMLPSLLSRGDTPALWLLVNAAMWGAVVLVVARLGLLAMAAAQFFFFMGLFYPYTTDLSAWYAGGTIFALAVCLAFAAYGFYVSTAGRPLFREAG